MRSHRPLMTGTGPAARLFAGPVSSVSLDSCESQRCVGFHNRDVGIAGLLGVEFHQSAPLPASDLGERAGALGASLLRGQGIGWQRD